MELKELTDIYDKMMRLRADLDTTRVTTYDGLDPILAELKDRILTAIKEYGRIAMVPV